MRRHSVILHAARSTCLTLCLMAGLFALAGCERTQQPGPGPKPISGSNTATPGGTGASGAQATPR